MISFPKFRDIFPELVGNAPAKLALTLNLIDPKCGGVLLIGEKGVGKSLLLKLFKKYLKIANLPYVEIPINVTEENLIRNIDIEKTLETGYKVYKDGLLDKAKDAYVLIENINLFPPEYLSLIFQNIYNYTVIATINPEEGFISEHFLDKIGMCVFMEKLADKEHCLELLNFWKKEKNLEDSCIQTYFDLNSYIKLVTHWKSKVKFDNAVWDHIVEICLENKISTHRAEIFLFFASHAYCALKGDAYIKPQYINFVAPLILLHRKLKKEPQPREEKKQEHFQKEQEKSKEPNKKQKKSQTQPNPSYKKEKRESFNKKDKDQLEEDNVHLILPSIPKEEVFSPGEIFKPKRLLLKKDRTVRTLRGKRTKSKTYLKGGRFVRSVVFSKDKDIDLFGTIKTSAPFQKLRGMKDKLIVHKEDIRYKEKERKIGHLFIFVVDGSGSMGAKKRMIATKGAIFSLLMDCYQKRDRVAIITFRKHNADILLPPTTSVELAYKRLKEIPTGGNTPLSAGLFEAYKLTKKHHLKFPEDRIILVLITDGKTNVPIKKEEDPLKEVKNICCEINQLCYVDKVVVDTEIKSNFLKMDYAKDFAMWLKALYFPLENIKSENLLNIIDSYKELSF